ncbi:MAG TPA: hypothetical protein VIE89_11170 [Candidatus Binatia bacterium]
MFERITNLGVRGHNGNGGGSFGWSRQPIYNRSVQIKYVEENIGKN